MEPVEVDALLIGMGERYDVLVTPADGAWPLVALAEGKDLTATAVVRTAGSTAAAPPADARPAELDGRLLAYVSVGGVEVNSLLVERGYACVLHIPPNGADRVVEFETLEAEAKAAGRGMWGSCEVVTCE